MQDLSKLEPTINGPFTPDLATPLSQFSSFVKKNGWKDELSAGLIGSCTNSSYEDMVRNHPNRTSERSCILIFSLECLRLLDRLRQLASRRRYGFHFQTCQECVADNGIDALDPRFHSYVHPGPNKFGRLLSGMV